MSCAPVRNRGSRPRRKPLVEKSRVTEGRVVAGQDDVENNARRHANEQTPATIILEIVIAGWWGRKADFAPVYTSIGVVVVRQQAITAPPRAIASIGPRRIAGDSGRGLQGSLIFLKANSRAQIRMYARTLNSH